jgi:hypothetical protein
VYGYVDILPKGSVRKMNDKTPRSGDHQNASNALLFVVTVDIDESENESVAE